MKLLLQLLSLFVLIKLAVADDSLANDDEQPVKVKLLC
jgi:hypothetical protein